MQYLSRKILYINLSKHSYDIKTYTDLSHLIGGLGMGLKLLEIHKEEQPLIFSIGPLNGIFPYVSKTCILTLDNKLQEFYMGGALSSRIRFAGFDAIVLTGASPLPVFLEISPSEVNFIESRQSFGETGLPGRSTRLAFGKSLLLDDYFLTEGDQLGRAFVKRNLGGMVINATTSFDIPNPSRYKKLYSDILEKKDSVSVFPANNPSCVGCPLGCSHSQVGETSGNVLAHSLVACEFARDIYSDLGIVFSCLNVLGYDYTHEDLENLPDHVKALVKDLRK